MNQEKNRRPFLSFIGYLLEKYAEPGEKERWITVYHENKPLHVLIDSKTGTILSGLGGKFTGKSIKDFYKASSTAYVKKLPKAVQEKLQKHYAAVNKGEPLPQKDTIYGVVHSELKELLKDAENRGLDTTDIKKRLDSLEGLRETYEGNTLHFSKTKGHFVSTTAEKLYLEAKEKFNKGEIDGDSFYSVKSVYNTINTFFKTHKSEATGYADENFVSTLTEKLKTSPKKEEVLSKAATKFLAVPKPETSEEKKEKALQQVKNQIEIDLKKKEYLRHTKAVHQKLDVGSKGLSEKVLNDIYAYTGEEYSEINKGLRQGKLGTKGGFLGGLLGGKSPLEERVRGMDAAMEKSVVTEPFVSFRGMFLQGDMLQKFLNAAPGDVLEDKGFVSTSTNPDKAFSGNIRLEITVPKGARAFSVQSISRYKDEDEIILDRGGSFKVVSILDEKNYKGEPKRTLSVVYVPGK